MSHPTSSCELLVIGGDDIRRLLSTEECIPLVERAMRRVSAGGAQMPLRQIVRVPGTPNMFGVMPGLLDDPASIGAKLIAIFPANTQRGMASHIGVVVLFDYENGLPTAIMDAASITSIRTAAATAVATRALARADAADLAILGTGEQASAHLRSIACVRKLRSVRVWGRSPDKAQAFARNERVNSPTEITVSATVQQAVEHASIVCAVTGAAQPILEGAWVEPGTHVNLVGASTAASREADDALVVRSQFFVDFRASALAQAGELLGAMGARAEAHIRGEIGDVLNGTVPGRRTDAEVTVYKSLGISAQDLASASFIYERARETGAGTRVRL